MQSIERDKPLIGSKYFGGNVSQRAGMVENGRRTKKEWTHEGSSKGRNLIIRY